MTNTTEIEDMDDWQLVKEDKMDLNEFVDKHFDMLYEYFTQGGEGSMPYGTMKGRSGDPLEWIGDRLESWL